MKPRFIEFDLDVQSVIDDYARRYVDDGFMNDTLDEAAEQCALDLMIPQATQWFKAAVRKLEKEMVTA